MLVRWVILVQIEPLEELGLRLTLGEGRYCWRHGPRQFSPERTVYRKSQEEEGLALVFARRPH